MIKRYSKLLELQTFEDRLAYLKICDIVGDSKFGGSRYINQKLYRSVEWKRVRNDILIRDEFCDLGIKGRLVTRPYVHHINPITLDDILNRNPDIFNPENLVCVSFNTHQLIHFTKTEYQEIDRYSNDTKLW